MCNFPSFLQFNSINIKNNLSIDSSSSSSGSLILDNQKSTTNCLRLPICRIDTNAYLKPSDSLMHRIIMMTKTTTIHRHLYRTTMIFYSNPKCADVNFQTRGGVDNCRTLAAVVSIAAVILPNVYSQCALSK